MIDYKLLGEAQQYYEALNYTYIDLPWEVPLKYINITLPTNHQPQKISSAGGYLVGSAEQSFLQYMDVKDIQHKSIKLMSITPCFRQEVKIDEYTRPYFMKLELCVVNPTDPTYFIEDMICEVSTFLKENGLKPEIEETLEGSSYKSYDIFHTVKDRKIELGSYGYRRHMGLRWVYGTGLAEPRTSLCINSLYL